MHKLTTGLRKYGVQSWGHGSGVQYISHIRTMARMPEHTCMSGGHGSLSLIPALEGGERNPLSKLAGNTSFISEPESD